MKYYYGLMTILCIGMVALTINKIFFYTPQFKIGDCLAYRTKNTEFIPSRIFDVEYKIQVIGKQDYLLYNYLNMSKDDKLASRNIEYIDENYSKVACP